MHGCRHGLPCPRLCVRHIHDAHGLKLDSFLCRQGLRLISPPLAIVSHSLSFATMHPSSPLIFPRSQHGRQAPCLRSECFECMCRKRWLACSSAWPWGLAIAPFGPEARARGRQPPGHAWLYQLQAEVLALGFRTSDCAISRATCTGARGKAFFGSTCSALQLPVLWQRL